MRLLPVREITQIGLLVAIIAVASLVAIPLGPVPLTLQVFAVLLAGLVLPPRAAVVSSTVYLLLGLVAPVFAAGTSGVAALAGPTGGYLVGFVPATLLVSLVARTHSSRLPVLPALLGLLPIYLCGALWLAWSLGIDSVWGALTAGVLPFVPLDVVKALLAASVAAVLVTLPLGLPEPPKARRDR